ncbi:MAG: hypothetical protein AAGF26_02095 [Cyanobacteria bacterium P01_G01_bin.49]
MSRILPLITASLFSTLLAIDFAKATTLAVLGKSGDRQDVMASTVLHAQKPETGEGQKRDYPAPEDQSDTNDWSEDGPWRVQVPGDLYSPRVVTAVTGPKFGVHSSDGAVRDLVKDTGIDFVGLPQVETLDVWTNFDGRTVKMILAETRLNGQPGVLFLLIGNLKGSDEYKLFGIETTRETFQQWGGVTRMLVLRDVIDSVESFPADKRQAIAKAPLANQVAVYEAALNALYKELSAGLILNQAQTLLRMQELNYDLLLGDDITSPFIAD